MPTSRLVLSAVTGIAMASLLAVPVSAMPISQPQTAIAAPGSDLLQQVQWRGRGYGYRGYYGGYRRGPDGAAVAAGVIGGLALGAVIAGAAAAPPPAYYAPPRLMHRRRAIGTPIAPRNTARSIRPAAPISAMTACAIPASETA